MKKIISVYCENYEKALVWLSIFWDVDTTEIEKTVKNGRLIQIENEQKLCKVFID